jgi:hypothetical protein
MEKQDLCRAMSFDSAPPRCRALIGACALVALMRAVPAHAEWMFDAAANWAHDSNLTRASAAADVRADNAAAADFALRWFSAPGEYDSVTLGIEGGGQVYRRYHGLDNARIGASAAYRHKNGVGLTAPWVVVEVVSIYQAYDEDVRTGPRLRVRAELGKRFDERLDARVGAFYEQRWGPDGQPAVPGISGKVFDLRGAGVDLGAAYAITETLAVNATVSTRRGDVVSTTSAGAPIFNASTAIAEDETFGDELYAYRLRGTTDTLALSLSWAIGRRASLSFGYTGERTKVAQGLDYRSNLATVSFLYRN